MRETQKGEAEESRRIAMKAARMAGGIVLHWLLCKARMTCGMGLVVGIWGHKSSSNLVTTAEVVVNRVGKA